MITTGEKTIGEKTPASILVVEDEVIVAEDLKGRLVDLGYEVSGIAHTGRGAVDAAAETAPDLVLMDIMLRGEMDGIAAAEEIKGRFGLPVIYLTAYSDEETLERAKTAEPFGYLLKPFEERELHASIEMALHKHRLEEELKEARARIKILGGFLPICASCKNIRDDKGYWSQIESYIKEHSEADFTHGLCPGCAKKIMDDVE